MKCALFFLLLVLLRLLPWGATQSTTPTPTEAASPLPETNGSTCAQWLYGTEPPRVEAFECAGQPDGAQVKFCCGTCAQTRNCSVEELADGALTRPTDGAPEPCPPPPPPTVPHWVKVTWFCGGVFATVIFYWAFYRTWRRFCPRKTSTRETQEEFELETSSSVRSSEHPGSSDASTRWIPPSSAGAEGLPNPREGAPFISSNLPILEPHPGCPDYVTVMWFPTVPPKADRTSASSLKQGGRSSEAEPRNQEVLQ